jgi:hypothetical protein
MRSRSSRSSSIRLGLVAHVLTMTSHGNAGLSVNPLHDAPVGARELCHRGKRVGVFVSKKRRPKPIQARRRELDRRNRQRVSTDIRRPDGLRAFVAHRLSDPVAGVLVIRPELLVQHLEAEGLPGGALLIGGRKGWTGWNDGFEHGYSYPITRETTRIESPSHSRRRHARSTG